MCRRVSTGPAGGAQGTSGVRVAVDAPSIAATVALIKRWDSFIAEVYRNRNRRAYPALRLCSAVHVRVESATTRHLGAPSGRPMLRL